MLHFSECTLFSIVVSIVVSIIVVVILCLFFTLFELSIRFFFHLFVWIGFFSSMGHIEYDVCCVCKYVIYAICMHIVYIFFRTENSLIFFFQFVSYVSPVLELDRFFIISIFSFMTSSGFSRNFFYLNFFTCCAYNYLLHTHTHAIKQRFHFSNVEHLINLCLLTRRRFFALISKIGNEMTVCSVFRFGFRNSGHDSEDDLSELVHYTVLCNKSFFVNSNRFENTSPIQIIDKIGSSASAMALILIYCGPFIRLNIKLKQQKKKSLNAWLLLRFFVCFSFSCSHFDSFFFQN